jgi:hypothetical protein
LNFTGIPNFAGHLLFQQPDVAYFRLTAPVDIRFFRNIEGDSQRSGGYESPVDQKFFQ